MADIAKTEKINITPFLIQLNASSMLYPHIPQVDLFQNDPTDDIDFLWKMCHSRSKAILSYSGVMSDLCSDLPGTSGVVFLPTIDLEPSTWIYSSTFNFVCKQALKQNCTPVLAYFNQPLF